MLRISKLADYGTVVLTHMARHSGSLHVARELAQVTNIPQPTVSKLLKILAHSALLASIRGTKGGYRLSRDPAEITVAQIVEAIDGGLALTECSIVGGVCTLEKECHVRGNWRLISQAVYHALACVTLQQLAAPMEIPLVEVPKKTKGGCHG